MGKLNRLDVVRTKFKTIAVVTDVNQYGDVWLDLPNGSTQKVGWYKPHELTLVGSIKNLVKTFDQQKLANAFAEDFPNTWGKRKCNAPLKHEWVGLTDEDIAEGAKQSWVDKQAFESAVWWAEAKLKEKNHD